MDKNTYHSAAKDVNTLGSIVPIQLVAPTAQALHKLNDALCGDVSGYVASRLHMSLNELRDALAAEQVDGVALAMYNIEKRAQSIIIGDQTGIGKGRQAAAMIRYGLLSGYLPIFFTDRYTLFSDMYRDCKALGIKEARPLIVNAGVSVVDFDIVVEPKETDSSFDEIWTPVGDEEDAKHNAELMSVYQKQYEVVYKSPTKKILQKIFENGELPDDVYDYLMITYSQLKDAKRDMTRVDFLQSLCEKHRVLFIFDEAHRSSSVSAGKISTITQSINMILSESQQTQCVFLSATFAKRPESLLTFMRRTALSALATEDTLETALHSGGLPMQEYVSTSLAAEGQMVRREHSADGLLTPKYTYLDDELSVHSNQFDKVMFFFREIVKLSIMVQNLLQLAQMNEVMIDFKCYPTRAQLFYINKVLLLSLKAQKVAEVAVDEVRKGRCVVIGMSDTLECILQDVDVNEDGIVRGDISTLLLRLLEKSVHSTNPKGDTTNAVFDIINESDDDMMESLKPVADEVKDYYRYIQNSIREEVFHLPMSPIDVIRQLIERETFETSSGELLNIRFEECTGRAHRLEYLSPDGEDDFVNARIATRKKRHSNHIFNDFQNNKLDVILINACGAIGASAHAISTAEVPDEEVRQRKMLIVQNDLDVNIDLQKRGRINRTGQRMDLPPLYEYIITSIPSEKRLNMMLRAKLRSLSANTAAWQDQDKEQADFVDLSNKYGDAVASDYIDEHPEMAFVLGLHGKVSASKLLARIAMLSVTAQQDIVDDLSAAYTTLEAELRRINQWDLERDYRDFEAEYVSDELFTTAKAKTTLGACSYLTTYKCKHKTFPYAYTTLMQICDEAKISYGKCYNENDELQTDIKKYYSKHVRQVHKRFEERQRLLYEGAKRLLVKYCGNETLADDWLQRACKPSDCWPAKYFVDVDEQKKQKLIMRKLISFSGEHNHLIDRESKGVKKYVSEKKRLIDILSKAVIGRGYKNIYNQLANEECPKRVIAVLTNIRFGKDERNRFLPSCVELVFALTAVTTEVRINLVHNKKWSNYDRLREILTSEEWTPSQNIWDAEIAHNNNKIVERKIITGNILGAYVHPAIAKLKPRFITFSLKAKENEMKKTQIGLLLPMDEDNIRKALNSVTIPLHEGLKWANNTSTSYPIAGLGVNFSLLPYRDSDDTIRFVISVDNTHSHDFEKDERFDNIRQYFKGNAVTSIYENKETKGKKSKPLMHYQTDKISFESEAFQTVMQCLAQMDAVIIVPRDQMSYGDIKEFSSRSERDANEAWPVLEWKNSDEVPMPPVKENLMLRISAPEVKMLQKGKPVTRHSEYYLLAKDTLELNGLSFRQRSTIDSLRRAFLEWRKLYGTSISKDNAPTSILTPSMMRFLSNELRIVIENKANKTNVVYKRDVMRILQDILDSEYLDTNGLYLTKFEEEMLFLSPDTADAQAFLDDMPCSPRLEGVRRCLQDYIDGKTDIINSPHNWI